MIPSSRLNRELARLLKDEGYIEGFSIERMRPPRGRRRRKGKTEFEMLASGSSTPRTASR